MRASCCGCSSARSCVGNRRGAPLAEIQAPLAAFPDLAGAFWHIPIEDSNRDGLVRLSFERPELPYAA